MIGIVRLFLLFSLVLTLPVSAAAEVSYKAPKRLPGAGLKFCSLADSTADLISCGQERLKLAEGAVNSAYDHLRKNLDLPIEDLENMQADWRAYRSSHCRIEKQIAAQTSQPLSRGTELHCLARLTERQAFFLMQADIQSPAPFESLRNRGELADPPRWWHVLTAAEPGTLWRLTPITRLDTNCDGRQERIMTGYNRSRNAAVIGFIDTPLTGQSSAQTLTLENCRSADLKLDATPQHGTEDQCTFQIIVEGPECPPQNLRWNPVYQRLKQEKDIE